MNKFTSFVLCFFSGTLAVLAVICLISPRMAWAKTKTLGVGIVRDWRVRIALLAIAGVVFGTMLVHPFFGVLASIAGNCYLFFGLKARGQKAEAEKDYIDEISDRINAGEEDITIEGRRYMAAVLARAGVSSKKQKESAEAAPKKVSKGRKIQAEVMDA